MVSDFRRGEAIMGSPALAVFFLFFGIGLLDAFEGGHWLRSLLWVGIGLAFWGLERLGRARRVGTKGEVGRLG
jgi:hypothetical protein